MPLRFLREFISNGDLLLCLFDKHSFQFNACIGNIIELIDSMFSNSSVAYRDVTPSATH